jgi:hypothetical protein
MDEYQWMTDPETGRQVYRRVRAPNTKRSSLPIPHIASDAIEIRSMVDGQIYTSKAALRASYRAKGYVEVGDQDVEKHIKPAPRTDRKAVREAAARALSKVGIPVG